MYETCVRHLFMLFGEKKFVNSRWNSRCRLSIWHGSARQRNHSDVRDVQNFYPDILHKLSVSFFSDCIILNLISFCATGGRFPSEEEYSGWEHRPVHPHVPRRKQGSQPPHPATRWQQVRARQGEGQRNGKPKAPFHFLHFDKVTPPPPTTEQTSLKKEKKNLFRENKIASFPRSLF